MKELLCGHGRFGSLWWSAPAYHWSCPVTPHPGRQNLRPTGWPAVICLTRFVKHVVSCVMLWFGLRGCCCNATDTNNQKRGSSCLSASLELWTLFWFQAHTRDRLTGQFRQLPPPCSRCGRTAGCPWVWMETCISLTSCSTTLSVITAATPDSRTKTPFNRRCPWLWKLWQVSAVVWQHVSISV